MFGKTRFPLPVIEKVTLELHLDWLFRQFNEQSLGQFEQLTPQSPILQSLYSRSNFRKEVELDRDGLLRLVESLLPFLSGNGPHVELIDWNGESQVPFDADIILLNPEEQSNPTAMISRIACRLSERYLMSLDPVAVGLTNRMDPKLLSELIPVLFGFGLFCANVSLRTTQFTDGDWHTWEHQKFTSTAARHFGVALAYLDWAFDRTNRQLTKALRPDARVPYQKALRYLVRTNDSEFQADDKTTVFYLFDVRQLVAQLPNASDSKTFAILDQLAVEPEAANFLNEENSTNLEPLLPFLPRVLQHKDESVRLAACALLRQYSTLDGEPMECLKDLMVDVDSDVRREATSLVVLLAEPGKLLARDLFCSMNDRDPEVVQAAVQGLLFLQQRDEDLVRDLLPMVRKRINSGDHQSLPFLIGALDTVSENAESHLAEYFQDDSGQASQVQAMLASWRETQHRVAD